MCDPSSAPKVLAYKVQMVGGSNWCAFDSLQGALDVIKEEIELGNNQYSYIIEPWEVSEDELYSLPEHDGDFS